MLERGQPDLKRFFHRGGGAGHIHNHPVRMGAGDGEAGFFGKGHDGVVLGLRGGEFGGEFGRRQIVPKLIAFRVGDLGQQGGGARRVAEGQSQTQAEGLIGGHPGHQSRSPGLRREMSRELFQCCRGGEGHQNTNNDSK